MRNRPGFLFLKFVLVILSMPILSVELLAVGVEFDGYFRTRGSYFYNHDLDRSQKPNVRAYSDFRFRLNPNFIITDKIRVKSSLNFIDAVAGQTPFRGNPFSNPAQANDPVLNNTINDGSTAGYRVGRPMTEDEMSSWVYGGAYAPDALAQTSDLTPILLRRAWAEVEFPIGVFKAGRMPFQLGLGIYGNKGDDVHQEIGSTRDRILFESGIGNYYLIPGVSWFYEGLVDQAADDAFEYFFHLGRKVEGQHISLYLSYLAQDEAVSASQNGSFQGEGTSYWLVDFYVENRFPKVNLAAEVMLAAGDFAGRDLLAVNAVAKADLFLAKKVNWIIEAGYASGTSDADVANDKIKSFAFNRDYNVSYILFEEAIPGGINRSERAPTSPHSGAISNAIYGRTKIGYEMTEFFHPYVNVLIPFAPENSLGAGGKYYGLEYNLITMWPLNDYVQAELTFAHFIPGGFFDNVSRSHQSTLLRAGLYVIF